MVVGSIRTSEETHEADTSLLYRPTNAGALQPICVQRYKLAHPKSKAENLSIINE